MSDKIKTIYEIYEMSENPREIIVFTSTFKARGKLFGNKGKTKDGVVTITDAVICPPFEKCQCEENAQYLEWLNIFDEEILAFSILA